MPPLWERRHVAMVLSAAFVQVVGYDGGLKLQACGAGREVPGRSLVTRCNVLQL